MSDLTNRLQRAHRDCIGFTDELLGVTTLEAEVQQYRALRPKCPRCKGNYTSYPPLTRQMCPDCTDHPGYAMPLDVWVGKLLDALREATDAFGKLLAEPHGDLSCYYADALASFAAVLALAGEDK